MISVEDNPNIRRCAYGHYFEVNKHPECPYCKDDYKARNNSIIVNTVDDDTDGSDGKTVLMFLDK